MIRWLRRRRRQMVPLAITLSAVMSTAAGAMAEPRRAVAAYLVAVVFWVSLGIGALSWLTLGITLQSPGWFLGVRRITQRLSLVLSGAMVLFVPIWLGLSELYPWVGEAVARSSSRGGLREAWLHPTALVLRGVVYLSVWAALAEIIGFVSRRPSQSRRPPFASTHLGAGGLVALAVTVTFAAFDWLMFREPLWHSSIYGLYVWVGAGVAGLSAMAVCIKDLPWKSEPIASTKTAATVGRLLFIFVCLWAYLAYCQLHIIWMADLPAEAGWYTRRSRGGWQALALLLIVGHFLLPFLVLMSSKISRHRVVIAACGLWCMAMHYLDVYWLVKPSPGVTLAPHWLDLSTLIATGMLLWWWLRLRDAKSPLLARARSLWLISVGLGSS